MKSKVRAMHSVVLLGAMLSLSAFEVHADSSSSDPVIVHFHLSGQMPESPGMPNPLQMMMGGDQPSTFKELLERFKKTAGDDSVKAVVLTFEGLGLGMGQMEELCKVIQQIEVSGKDVYVHAEQMSTFTYLLASATSHINIVPTGDLWLTGFYSEMPYVKGLLMKLGVDVDFMQFEKYKSAAETFTREGPTPEAEENRNWLLDGLYDASMERIAKGRKMSAEKVKSLVDDGPYSAERALEADLIDSVMHRREFFDDLKGRFGGAKVTRKYGHDKGPEIPSDLFGFFGWVANALKGAGQESSTAPSVGIVYVEGAIKVGSGKSDNPFSAPTGAFSTPIRKALDKAANDDSVKAVVLRVDSPGGSALASEIILEATRRVASKKPLIVSMGNVAGSGGYYVACASRAIFADETTITASIGVLGGKLVTTGGWSKLGINWHSYKRGNMAGIMSSSARFSDTERAKIHGYMSEVYEIFKGHVVACRGDKLTKPIGEIAGGRVFTGGQALELGLIDEIGGMQSAIKFAAAEANLGDYEVRVIPRPKEPLEMLMEAMSGGGDDDEDVSINVGTTAPLFGLQSPLMQAFLPVLEQLDPQRVQAVMGVLERIELINAEGVITMMPETLVIR